MKKLLASIVMAAASLGASAAGVFDGIYQSTANPQHFYSLHQNGSTLLMTTYSGVPSDGSLFLSYGGSKLIPPAIYLWEVQIGQINGAQAVLSGGTLQNACNVTIQLDLAESAIVGTIIASSQTPIGAAQNFPCSRLLPVGTRAQANRMF